VTIRARTSSHARTPVTNVIIPGWQELAPLGEPAFQGEHNHEVFVRLGFDNDEIDAHIASGALVCALPASPSNVAKREINLPLSSPPHVRRS
jgi:hypothetical protein